jgi:hypothetical protein
MIWDEFSQAVIEQIGYYVYLLSDPATDEVFYVGKGTSNRIFAHINDALTTADESDKLDRIRAIHARGDRVHHMVLRHGLTEKEAFEVEAATIDLMGLDILSNAVSGHHSFERGMMTAQDIMSQYDAHKVNIEAPSLLIIINRLFEYGMSEAKLYDITRGNWVLGPRRNGVKYAYAVYRGIVRQVYRIDEWEPVHNRDPNQKTRERWRFSGDPASELQHHVGGTVEHYFSAHAQNPIRYVNC